MPSDFTTGKSFFSTRQIPNSMYATPLPFYAASTGVNVYGKGESDQAGGILNQFVRITWVLTGTCEILINDKMQLIGPNTVMFQLYGDERVFRSVSNECRFRWLCIDGPFAESIMLSFRYPRVQRWGEYPAHLFAELDRIMGEESPDMVRRKSCIVMELLASMAEKDDSPYANERIVAKCLAMIRRNFSDPNFGLETLCEQFSISRTTLTRLFRRETCFSPGRFILNEKMAKAVGLLSGTDLPIEVVAKQCGFRDRPTFTRFIRRGKGMSPTEFREQCTQGASPK